MVDVTLGADVLVGHHGFEASQVLRAPVLSNLADSCRCGDSCAHLVALLQRENDMLIRRCFEIDFRSPFGKDHPS